MDRRKATVLSIRRRGNARDGSRRGGGFPAGIQDSTPLVQQDTAGRRRGVGSTHIDRNRTRKTMSQPQQEAKEAKEGANELLKNGWMDL